MLRKLDSEVKCFLETNHLPQLIQNTCMSKFMSVSKHLGFTSITNSLEPTLHLVANSPSSYKSSANDQITSRKNSSSGASLSFSSVKNFLQENVLGFLPRK